jgi:uncharacterized membrane protein YphA (DoxX/SURF4 family)
MNTKTKNIIRWVLAVLIAFIFFGSAFSKLTADSKGLEDAAKFGLDASEYASLGIIEIVAVLLFLIPRTGIIGSLLLVAYMGGAISTHVEFSQPILAPVMISVFVWIVAFVRFPELSKRLLNK